MSEANPGNQRALRKMVPNFFDQSLSSGIQNAENTHSRKKRNKEERDDPLKELISAAGDLPETYHETKIVAMAVGPYRVHVYWDLTPEDLRKFTPQPGQRPKAVLRFHEMTGDVFNASETHIFFDLSIDLQAKNWYISLWSPHKSYVIELGTMTPGGQFVPVTSSKPTQTPSDRPSSEKEVKFILPFAEAPKKTGAFSESAGLKGKKSQAAEGRPAAENGPLETFEKELRTYYRREFREKGPFSPMARPRFEPLREPPPPRQKMKSDFVEQLDRCFIPGSSSK
jgi:hypothetical protein